MTDTPRPSRRLLAAFQRGFTLIEALIAVSLTALLMLGLGGALFALGTSSARVDDGLARSEALRVLPAFLHGALGAVADSARFEGMRARTEGFRGTREELRWIGALPARHGVGGLHHLRLHLDVRGNERVLVLQYRPFTGPGAAFDWNEVPGHALIAGVDSFALAFQVPSPDAWNREPAWRDDWPHADRLPSVVMLSLSVDGVPWPPLVIPLIPLPTEGDGFETLEHGMPS